MPKFYIANDNGHRKVCTTQAQAKAIDKDFSRLNVPVGQNELQTFLQKLFDIIDKQRLTIENNKVPPATELQSPTEQEAPPAEELAQEPVQHATREQVDAWFEPNEGAKPIDKILAKAGYAEAMIIQSKATERMVHCLVETRLAVRTQNN